MFYLGARNMETWWPVGGSDSAMQGPIRRGWGESRNDEGGPVREDGEGKLSIGQRLRTRKNGR